MSKEQADRPTEGASVLRLIASRLEELAFFVRVLADQDQGAEPETPEGEVAERKLTDKDLDDCWRQRGETLKRCYEEHPGEWRYCYARATIAEANCLKFREAELERK